MERILINNLISHIGSQVKIQGWVHRIRKLGKIAFLLVRDRSGIVQCVLNTKEIDISGLKLESVVEVLGEVKEVNGGVNNVEIALETLKLMVEVKEDLPIEINKEELEANLDTILNNRVLSLRHPKENAIFKIFESISFGFQLYLRQEGFTQVFTPKIVAEGAEGGTELFSLDYFGRKAYLAQSPQFYKQMLVGSGFERVYEIGHVYRAEEHDTQRHLNEIVCLDVEMAFIENEREVMVLETKMLEFTLEYVKKTCQKELALLKAEVPVIEGRIPSMRLSEAIEILETEYRKERLTVDLDPEGEKLISQYVKEKYNSDFVFITHYLRSKRPMYTMPAEGGLTGSFDLLFRGLEITSGGQRIHQYEMLIESMLLKGLQPENFKSYLDVFRYGMPPHGGFAIGLERLTGQLLGFKNIRETTLFPRDKNRLIP